MTCHKYVKHGSTARPYGTLAAWSQALTEFEAECLNIQNVALDRVPLGSRRDNASIYADIVDAEGKWTRVLNTMADLDPEQRKSCIGAPSFTRDCRTLVLVHDLHIDGDHCSSRICADAGEQKCSSLCASAVFGGCPASGCL